MSTSSPYTPGTPGDPAALSDFERAYIARNFPQPEPETTRPCVSCGEELDDCIARELAGLAQRFCCADCEHVATRLAGEIDDEQQPPDWQTVSTFDVLGDDAAMKADAPGAPLVESQSGEAAHAALVRRLVVGQAHEDVRLVAHTLAGLLDEATAQGEGYAAEIEAQGFLSEGVAEGYTRGVLRAQLDIASTTLLRVAEQLSS